MNGYDICNFKIQYLCHDIIMSLYRIISDFHCEGGSCLVILLIVITSLPVYCKQGPSFGCHEPFCLVNWGGRHCEMLII